MTDRPLPPPPRSDEHRLPWLKIGALAAVLLLIVVAASSWFGGGLGTPDDARRTRHPAGFSLATPIGWAATVYNREARGADTIRLMPARSTGRQTVLESTRIGAEKPKFAANVIDAPFQNQPAFYEIAQGRYDWTWRVTFARDGIWYHVQIVSPIELDATSDPLIVYANSFRLETPIGLLTSQPATSQP